MKFLDMFDKLDDIIYKPIEMMTDWAREPLKAREHKRKEQSADNELERDLRKEKERKEVDSDIKIKEAEKRAEIAIKKETEVVRIIAEIEEWKKDQEFNRMKAVSEAISKYQKELTQLNVGAVNAIGTMQIELREKAQNLVYEKTIKYKDLQKTSTQEAMEELKRVETEFSDNEVAKEILNKAIEDRLRNIINVAANFLQELNDDIRSINKNITLLAESGHRFIETHLAHFQALGFSDEEIKKLKDAKEVEAKVIDQE